MQEKILIVEDETDMANLLNYRLAEIRYKTQLAFNGKEAVEKINQEIPDLVLLDIMMTPIDGWEVCSTIRKSSDETVRRLPIIMLTALPAAEDKIRGLELGADDYLLKPVNMDELILKIQNMLRKKRIEDELMERLKRGNDIPALFYHEVKNQLHVIGAYSHLIVKENITRDKREQFSEILNNTASAISEYLEGMSLFSKIESGEMKIKLENFSLKDVINKIILSYKKDAIARGIRIEADYAIAPSPQSSPRRGEEGGIPFSPSPEGGEGQGEGNLVNLNPIAMKMVLSNLIGNAIKYNKKDGSVLIKVEIASPEPALSDETRLLRFARNDTSEGSRNDKEAKVSLRGRSPKQSMFKEGSRLVITVEDTGLGIEPVDIPHIFDKFYRSRSVEGHISGTGIGLYIVKTLVDAMGGNVELKSSLGKGSKFIVSLGKR